MDGIRDALTGVGEGGKHHELFHWEDLQYQQSSGMDAAPSVAQVTVLKVLRTI